MSRKMSAQEWRLFERAAISFCELRAEYRRRKADQTLGEATEARMVQELNALDLHLDRLKRGNELELARAVAARPRSEPAPRVRKAAGGR